MITVELHMMFGNVVGNSCVTYDMGNIIGNDCITYDMG